MSISADKSERMWEIDSRGRFAGKNLGLVFLLLAVVFASLGFSVFTYLQWREFRHSVETSLNLQINDSKTYIGTNIKGFEERVVNLEKIMEPFSLLKPEATLDQAIEKANSEVEARNEERFRKVQEKIDAMTEEVIKAREKVESSNKKELLFISLVKLRQKIDSAQPFSSELDLVQLGGGHDKTIGENVDALRKSEKGVPSIIELRDDFSKIAGNLVRKQKEEAVKEKPFYERFTENLYHGVSIRKVRNVAGDSPEAVVARTEEDLQKGNISEALQELDKLNLPDNQDLTAWREKAKSYKEADAAFNNMLGHIIDEDVQKTLSQAKAETGEAN